MNRRPIDFYIKGLPFDIRQEIFKRLEVVHPYRMRKLLDKPNGYPIFRSLGYTEDEITEHLAIYPPRFAAVNEYMIENGRPPLFTDPHDTYRSALESVDLMEKKTEEQLLLQFGCLWQEYTPENI